MTNEPGKSGDPNATANLVARIIVSMLLGGTFVAASAYAIREFVGTPAILMTVPASTRATRRRKGSRSGSRATARTGGENGTP